MLAYVFVIFAVAVRFLPHPWGFTPVAASLLFFGARASRRQMWIPFALFALADIVLTRLVYSYPFSWDHYVTWGWYIAVLALGTRLRQHAKPLWVVVAALTSSVTFFLASNFASWSVLTDLYPRTLAGLMQSYVAGLPFFRRALVGDLLFTSAMFTTAVLWQLWSASAARHSHPGATV